MRKLPLVLLILLCGFVVMAGHVRAQSSPNLYAGQVPTAGQWNSYFAAKQDYNANFFSSAYTWNAPQTWTTQSTFQAHVALQGAIPAVTSCGTSPSLAGSDSAGEVTTGTGSPTACTITFGVAYTATPICVVVDRTALANLTSYTVSTTAITLTTSAASSQKIDYHCFGA